MLNQCAKLSTRHKLCICVTGKSRDVTELKAGLLRRQLSGSVFRRREELLWVFYMHKNIYIKHTERKVNKNDKEEEISFKEN